MITLSRLIQKFTLNPDFIALIQNGDPASNLAYSKDQAARLLCLHDIHAKWRSLSRADLLTLFKQLEWTFNNPPSMTYDKVFSSGIRIQVIPTYYLTKVDLASADTREAAS